MAMHATPALRREEIKLQIALINPLIHIKGYGAPETKAVVERARFLMEQAEALGEPAEDPLLLFSVLYGNWVASAHSSNADAARGLAAQILALAEKQEAPADDRDYRDGHLLVAPWRIRKSPSASR